MKNFKNEGAAADGHGKGVILSLSAEQQAKLEHFYNGNTLVLAATEAVNDAIRFREEKEQHRQFYKRLDQERGLK